MAKIKKIPLLLAASLLILLLLMILTYQVIISNKYYPLTFVGDTNISFLTEGQAIRKIQASFDKRVKRSLQFNFSSKSFTVDLSTSSAQLNYHDLDEVFYSQHHTSYWSRIIGQLHNLFSPTTITPKITLLSDQQLDAISSQITRSAQDAQLIFDETPISDSTASAHIQIKEAIDGLTLDKGALKDKLAYFLLTGQSDQTLPIKVVSAKITTDQIKKAKVSLETVMTEPVKLTFENYSWLIDAKQLLTLLDLTKGTGSLLDKDQLLGFLKNISLEIDQEVQEGQFEFNPQTKRVTAFKPSQKGQKLDLEKTFQLLNEALANNSKAVALPVMIIQPKIAVSDVNSLGIQELLGRGKSNFAGSIPNRIFNINLTASKITGILIPPGEIFSFNNTVGDISAATGFKQAYVIKEGRTILDDGGGVCQDSTTLFRAVLNAGLPVIKRTAHAYRVGYYEQGFPPGLDATVFYPSVDFQFKNDTGYHILIQAYTTGTTLYVDLYGTPDGRVANLTQPVVTNQTPPPPELRQDDPTLPKGSVKQVDWSAWGASVAFKRTVTSGGETLIDETWKSFYKPWQAVYLVGTQ